MSNSTYFIQVCPTCGRSLHVRVEYLNKKVICQHCRGGFVTGEPACQHANGLESADVLLRRAEERLRDAPRTAQSVVR